MAVSGRSIVLGDDPNDTRGLWLCVAATLGLTFLIIGLSALFS